MDLAISIKLGWFTKKWIENSFKFFFNLKKRFLMILCKEIGKHFSNKIFSIGRCFVFDSINWIGSLISNGYWYNCSCAWCGPWASYYFTWWMLKWAFFFFYQNVFCLLVVSVCLKFIFHHFQSQCVLVYRARRGRGICYQIQIIVQSLQKGEIFQIFFKLKRQVLD